MKLLISGILILFGSLSFACQSVYQCSYGETCVKWEGASLYDEGRCINTGYDQNGQQRQMNTVKECKRWSDCPTGFQCSNPYGAGVCVRD